MAPNTSTEAGSTRPPKRSTIAPIGRMEVSAPIPTHRSATPSAPSLTFACALTAGRDAPNVPQNRPKAAKPTSARPRPGVGADLLERRLSRGLTGGLLRG